MKIVTSERSQLFKTDKKLLEIRVSQNLANIGEHEARDLYLGDCLFHGPETILKQTGFKVTGKPFFLHILNVS